MQREYGHASSSPVIYKDSEPFVYVCKSTPSCEEAVLCSCDRRDSLHTSDEEWGCPTAAEPSAGPGPLHERPCPQDDHGWVTVCPSDCYRSCKCGTMPQSAIFPDTLLSCAQTSVSGKSGTEKQSRKKCYLQRTGMYDIDDRETGPSTRPFPLCNYRGCGGPHDHETVERPCSHQHEPQSPDCPRTKNLSITERPREMAKSPGGMKGGCSLFGLGSSWDRREDQSGCRELSSGNQQNDLYLREKDEIGTTCLSYKPSLLQSATLASGEDDFCRSSRKHGSRKDRQRPATCDSDHSCGCGGGLCTQRRATGAKIRAAKSECGKVPKCCGIAPFPRGNSSWLNSATQHKLRESPCSGRRLPRNKSFLQRLQKQEGECCERVSPGSFLREDTSWRSRQVRGSGRQGGADRCAGKTDDVYVCELDDVGTSSLFYKQRPSSCGFSDNEESPCELCRSKKAHPKDTCQHLSCKRYKSQPIPGRTRCSQCSDDTSSLMSLKQGDCHTSNYRTNGGSTPIICSLPQWPRHLLLQNNRAQATTTVYKN